MAAFDPTFPLFPIATILSVIMMFLVLLTSFIRQKWNLGVAFLCFWLMLEQAGGSANLIIWSDNGDVKYYVFCDIWTRLELIAAVTKPMATFITIRRLYLITSLKSVEMPNARARRVDIAIEWTLGLIIPVLVAGPLYYSVQIRRFDVYAGFGCTNAPDDGILALLLLQPLNVIPPILSVTIYYPKVAMTFFRQHRDVNEFFNTNGSISRNNYMRLLALASIDAALTLPLGIANLVLAVFSVNYIDAEQFYPGWSTVHSDWDPVSFSNTSLRSMGTAFLVRLYLVPWISPVLAFTIFGLFGFTPEARSAYLRIFRAIARWFRWKPSPRARASLDTIEFSERPHRTSMDLEIGSRPSFVAPVSAASNQARQNKDITVNSDAVERSRPAEACASNDLEGTAVDQVKDIDSRYVVDLSAV